MNRFVLLGVAGVVIVAAAVALLLLDHRGIGESGKAQTGATATVPALTQKTPAAGSGDATQPPPPGRADRSDGERARETVAAPSFGVIRVSPSGDTVVAGSAQPGAEVTVSDKNKVIGQTKADKRGDWVLLPDKPLSPGDHELTAASRTDSGTAGTEAQTERKIIIVVPEAGKDIAAGPSADKASALVLAVPRSGSGSSVVMQKPGPPKMPPGARTAASGASSEAGRANAGRAIPVETVREPTTTPSQAALSSAVSGTTPAPQTPRHEPGRSTEAQRPQAPERMPELKFAAPESPPLPVSKSAARRATDTTGKMERAAPSEP